MSKGDIRLSPKHGVNASMGICYVCNEDSGEIILPGLLKGDQKAPHKAVWHDHPCPKCEDWMKKGVILISVKDGEDHDNPYRTGGWCVLKDEAIERMPIDDAMKRGMIKHRMAFLEDEAWDALGIPREASNE